MHHLTLLEEPQGKLLPVHLSGVGEEAASSTGDSVVSLVHSRISALSTTQDLTREVLRVPVPLAQPCMRLWLVYGPSPCSGHSHLRAFADDACLEPLPACLNVAICAGINFTHLGTPSRAVDPRSSLPFLHSSSPPHPNHQSTQP